MLIVHLIFSLFRAHIIRSSCSDKANVTNNMFQFTALGFPVLPDILTDYTVKELPLSNIETYVN
jgi:hypothetical protein